MDLSKIEQLLLQLRMEQNPLFLVYLGWGMGLILLLGFVTWFFLHRLKKKKKLAAKDRQAEQPTTSKIIAEQNWQQRLREGLSKTRNAFVSGLEGIFKSSPQIDDKLLEELHELLFRSDIGVKTADTLVNFLREFKKSHPELDSQTAKQALKEKALSLLSIPSQPIEVKDEFGPLVILIVGVNGVGKTTSIGKLAAYFRLQDKKVMLAAGDTFRAAAIEQLQVWANRLDVPIIAHQAGSDPAAVCYDAVKAAIARNYDVLLIDTAGRLQNKSNLMSELDKIKRVIGKDLPGAPQHTWLVIDATTGQNAFSQVRAFKEVVDLNGLIVTKLDGTAKGGVTIGISDLYKVPVRFIGVGEKAEDLRPFEPQDFVDSIFNA